MRSVRVRMRSWPPWRRDDAVLGQGRGRLPTTPCTNQFIDAMTASSKATQDARYFLSLPSYGECSWAGFFERLRIRMLSISTPSENAIAK